MTSHLESILNSVDDEQSFLRFLQALAKDWHDDQEKALTNASSPYAMPAVCVFHGVRPYPRVLDASGLGGFF